MDALKKLRYPVGCVLFTLAQIKPYTDDILNSLGFLLQVMNEDGHTSSIRDKILTFIVKAGWNEGTRITFPKEGDQA